MSRTLAYLDPGSAGVILQMIGGGAAALLVALKLYGRKMRRFILRNGTDGPEPEPTQASEEAVSQRDGV
jgi:hypothetical protein